VAAKVHQFLTFTTAPNLQVAVAYGLGKPADYFFAMRKELARSRDRLTTGLERIGFPVLGRKAPIFSPSTSRRSVSTKPTRHSASAS